MDKNLGILLLLIFIGLQDARNVLEQVDDTDLVHLLTGEENVIVLFTKNNCQSCDELEMVVESIEKELKDNIGPVVKAHNSHMVNLYNPFKEPALIYFRRGVPLLYHGEQTGEEILQLFNENREPVVKELSDANFEHLTQSATGATTGDWFVFFYSTDCVLCSRLHATWEAVGSRLKHRLNVARVDRLGAGIATANRFNIVQSPGFVYLRQGKLYRYKHKDFTAQKLIEFGISGFLRQGNPEDVPPEGGELDNFFSSYLESLNKSQFMLISSVAILLTIICGCLFKFIFLKKKTVNQKKKAKKSK